MTRKKGKANLYVLSHFFFLFCFSINSSVRQESEEESEEIEIEDAKMNKKHTQYVQLFIHITFYSPAYRRRAVSDDEPDPKVSNKTKKKYESLVYCSSSCSFCYRVAPAPSPDPQDQEDLRKTKL